MTEHSRATESAFDDYYGLRVVACTGDEVRGELDVEAHHLQPTQIVHGGVHCSIAEALASFGTNEGVGDHRRVGLGLSNATSFLRPAGPGRLTAVAVPQHRGRTTWVWDVTISDEIGRTCAISRVTIAVRDRPAELGQA
jgi:1,4-dihydroxy-2-naphthoyl-CoA hydrolase